MLAGVLIEIDQFRRFGDGREGRLLDRFRFTHEGEHGAIVIGIGMLIEKGDTLDRRDGRSDLGDHFGPARFAEIGNAFDNLCHDQNPWVSWWRRGCVRQLYNKKTSRRRCVRSPGGLQTRAGG